MARILIVDDSPTETYRFKEILERHGHVALEAANGADGVAVARAELPDLVLMELGSLVQNLAWSLVGQAAMSLLFFRDVPMVRHLVGMIYQMFGSVRVILLVFLEVEVQAM